MSVDLTTIVENMSTILGAIPTPVGARQPQLSVEPPVNSDTLPLWFVLEQDTDLNEYREFGPDSGHVVHLLNIYLIVGAVVETTYNVRERRLWSQPVYDAFEDDQNLSGACDALYVTGIQYGVIVFNDLHFVGTTFKCRVLAPRS